MRNYRPNQMFTDSINAYVNRSYMYIYLFDLRQQGIQSFVIPELIETSSGASLSVSSSSLPLLPPLL